MARADAPVSEFQKEDYTQLAEFRYRLRKFLGFSESAAIAHGVSAQQYQAMLAIQGSPGKDWLSVGELAEQMQVAHHSAGGLVKRMESQNLVRKTSSGDDRRSVQIRLTAKGLKILEKLIHAHKLELAVAGPELVDVLTRAATRMNPDTTRAARSRKKPQSR